MEEFSVSTFIYLFHKNIYKSIFKFHLLFQTNVVHCSHIEDRKKVKP